MRDGKSNVEINWAICKAEAGRVGTNVSPCKSHWYRNITSVVPQGSGFAVERTSGCQDGTINSTTTYISLKNEGENARRESHEWTVVSPDIIQEPHWVGSGIGVYRDSGACVLQNGTDDVAGQLWGRDFVMILRMRIQMKEILSLTLRPFRM